MNSTPMSSKLTDSEIRVQLKQKDNEILQLARSVKVIQNQMDRILVVLEKLVTAEQKRSSSE